MLLTLVEFICITLIITQVIIFLLSSFKKVKVHEKFVLFICWFAKSLISALAELTASVN